jgi:hypothetical protein
MGRYRKKIEFDVIKETEKAMLINVKDCKSTAFRKLVKKAKKYMVLNPLEVWVPKSWIKHDRYVTWVGMPGNLETWENKYWIWEQGFLKNLCKIFNERVDNNWIDLQALMDKKPEKIKEEINDRSN